MADAPPIHDFTDALDDRFYYKVPGENLGDDPITVTVDLFGAGLRLRELIPTAFALTDEKKEDGEFKTGIQVVFERYRDNQPLPENLPPFRHVINSVREALEVPDHCGFRITMMAFVAFSTELARRGELKKDFPGSLDLSGPTPEPSEPGTSAGTQSSDSG